jgi:lysophospholipase L1-like esterase
MGKSRGRHLSRAWSIGGVSVVGALVLGLSTAALTSANGQPAGVGSVPELPASSAEPSAAPEKERLTAWTAEQVRASITGDADMVISVLGDSTGVGPDRWVAGYAAHLSESATVTLHPWVEATESYGPATVTGDGPRRIEIWNGSFPGANWSYGTANLDALQPVAPDLTIGNYGHNQGPQPIDVGYAALVDALSAKNGEAPALVVTIQNPAAGARAAISAEAETRLARWAEEWGVPTIDVLGAFGDQTGLLLDDVHPNVEGSRLWLEAAVASLG